MCPLPLAIRGDPDRRHNLDVQQVARQPQAETQEGEVMESIVKAGKIGRAGYISGRDLATDRLPAREFI
jgi:hypothetical protein